MEEKRETNNEGIERLAAEDTPSISFARILLRVVTVSLILMMSLGAFKALSGLRKPPPREPVPPVSLRAQTQLVSLSDRPVVVSGKGTVTAKREMYVVPEVPGKVVYVHPEFREGGTIEKGETMFRIEMSDYSENKEQVKAKLSANRSDIELLQNSIENIKSVLDDAEDNLRIAETETDRMRRLFEKEIVTETSLNQQISMLNSATMEYKQAKDSLDTLEKTLEKAKSAEKASLAQLTQASNQVGRTESVAPFTGRLTSLSGGNLSVGQVVAPGNMLMKLQDTSAFEIEVPISLSDWQAIAPGVDPEAIKSSPIKARVTWRNGDGEVFEWWGTVVRTGSELDPRNRLISVIVEIADGMGRTENAGAGKPSVVEIVPMMFCEVEFTGPVLEDVAVIPRRALRSRKKPGTDEMSGLDFAYLVKDEKLDIKEIQVWRHTGEEIFVTGGLAEGDEIITSVVEVAVDGMPVIVTSRAGEGL